MKYIIKLENYDKFKCIINHKEDAFKQILKYGGLKEEQFKKYNNLKILE